jgi:hypothetical protein
MKYTLTQGHPRGFLSTYVTIMTSFRYLTRRGVDPIDIAIDRGIFSLYGAGDNWFDYPRWVDSISGQSFNVMATHKKEEWTTEELGKSVTDLPFSTLHEYSKLMPLNTRMKDQLEKHSVSLDGALGIHYRGTDHQGYHTIPVSLTTFLTYTGRLLGGGKFSKVFLASDERAPYEKIRELVISYPSVGFIGNDFYRSATSTPIHFTQMEPAAKIQTADEVLIDATMLSKCAKILARHSNILNYAWIINPQIDVTYLDGAFQHV